MKPHHLIAVAVLALVLSLGWQTARSDGPLTPPNTLTEQEKKDGWKLLFDGKTLNGWRVYKGKDSKGWVVKEESIHLEKPGSGDLITEEKFANFEFAIDWRFETGNNSGIIYRVAETGGPSWATGPEMQVMYHNPKDKLGKTSGGSLYDMFAPTANPFKGKDSWTTFKIVARGKHLEHWVNGVKVVETDIGSAAWNEALDKSKWKKYSQFASQPTGHIGLQDHGGKIYFRNVKIRLLPDESQK